MDAKKNKSKANGGKSFRSRMESRPPAPPPAPPCAADVAARAQKTKSVRRPKTPPPRRPPRPVVKEKSQGSDDASESRPAASETSSDVVVKSSDGTTTAGRDPNSSPNDRNGRKSDVVDGRKSTMHIPLGRKKRKAPDVPRTRPATGDEAVVDTASQKGGPEGWRLISKSFSPADLGVRKEPGQRLDTLRLRKGSLDDDVLTRSKPIVHYVKIVKKDRGTDPIDPNGDRSSPPPPPAPPWSSASLSKSVDELDRFGVLLELGDVSYDHFYGRAFRSSFLEETTLRRQTIGFHSDIQTLLKHSRKDDEHIYSLPQPQSYSDETLKAVKLITDKYDTLQRRRLHAASFREADLARLRGTLTLHRELSGGSKADARDADGLSTSPRRSLPSANPPPISGPLPEEKDAEDVVCGVTGLSRKDVLRLEMFYKGHDTEVVVCSCLADLYLGNAPAPGSEPTDWLLHYTGVPIWVLNTGAGQRCRELHVYLAERETGFPLWRDKINYLSNLEAADADARVLTMRLSGGLSRMAKLSVFCREASVEFHRSFLSMTADPGDELWCVSRPNGARAGRRGRSSRRRRHRSFTVHDISQPCNFQHVAKLDPSDPQVLAALALLMGTNTETVKGRNAASLPTAAASQHQNLPAEHMTV